MVTTRYRGNTLRSWKIGPLESRAARVAAKNRRLLRLCVAVAALTCGAGCGDGGSVTNGDTPLASSPPAEGAETELAPGATQDDGGVEASVDAGSLARLPAVVEPPFLGPPDLTAGVEHTCALQAGRVRCWGGNEFHQLGDPSLRNGRGQFRAARLPVAGVTRAVALGAGAHHTCAIVEGGELRCWGHGGYGQLGDGGRDDAATPRALALPAPARSVSAGDGHTCAATTDGAVYCWGRNDHGQLGDGTLTARGTPVRVATPPGAVVVAAGRLHTCAHGESGWVACWGLNLAGQLGPRVRVAGAHRATPEVVAQVSDAVGLASGVDHTCALRRNGRIVCWGRNDHQQLRLDRLRGVPATAQLSLGEGHSCVLVPGTRLTCVGANRRRQLGRGPAVIRAPRHIREGDLAARVALGYRHTCLLGAGGTVRCLGEPEAGRLGAEEPVDGERPAPAAP